MCTHGVYTHTHTHNQILSLGSLSERHVNETNTESLAPPWDQEWQRATTAISVRPSICSSLGSTSTGGLFGCWASFLCFFNSYVFYNMTLLFKVILRIHAMCMILLVSFYKRPRRCKIPKYGTVSKNTKNIQKEHGIISWMHKVLRRQRRETYPEQAYSQSSGSPYVCYIMYVSETDEKTMLSVSLLLEGQVLQTENIKEIHRVPECRLPSHWKGHLRQERRQYGERTFAALWIRESLFLMGSCSPEDRNSFL